MEIKKNQFVFQFKNGDSLIMDNEDYEAFLQRLKFDLILKMNLEMPDRVYFETDFTEHKVAALYKIIQEQKEMSNEMRDNYLNVILELTKSDIKGAESLKVRLEKNGQSSKPPKEKMIMP